jgi:hypothetical protein
MKKNAWRHAIMVLLLPTGCGSLSTARAEPANNEHWTWGQTSEAVLRAEVIGKVKAAARQEDFATLDRMEADFRGPQGITPSGASTLALLHQALLSQLTQDIAPGHCEGAAEGVLERWARAAPRSATRIIAHAQVLESQAWCHRGQGTADTVLPQAWQPYEDNLDAASAVLESGRAMAEDDPAFYTTLEDLYIDQDRPRAALDRLLDAASARFPYYYDLYFTAYRANRPGWGGNAAMIDQGARYAAARTRAQDGMSAYVRVYWHMVVCGCHADLQAMDWPTMKVAMADLAQRHPDDWTTLHLVQLSCLEGDAEAARTYFDRLGVNQIGGWTPAQWNACRTLVGRSAAGFPG